MREGRRFWWRGTTPTAHVPLTLPPLTLAVDPADRRQSPGHNPLDRLPPTPSLAPDQKPASAFATTLFGSAPSTTRDARLTSAGDAPRQPRGRTARGIAGRASLFVTLAGIAVFALASLGGTRLAPPGSLAVDLDRLAAAAGLAIRDIAVTGHENTRDSEVFAALDGLRARSLIGFDTRLARLAVERLAWVDAASVTRAWPDRIVVEIRERRPAAIWHGDGGEWLIDATGHRLARLAVGVAAGLPIVAGKGAPQAAGDLLAELATRPELQALIARAERVADRRWTLVTHGGQRVLLPAGHRPTFAAALDRLMAGRDGTRLIDRRFAILDLRSADRLVLTAPTREATL